MGPPRVDPGSPVVMWAPPALMASGGRTPLGGRLAAAFGGVSGGLGTFGALHNVCHYTCQIVVAALGIAGIGLTGLPLAFLEDPKLVVLFGGMGTVSLGVSMSWHLKAKGWSLRSAGLRSLFDRRTAILLVFLVLSGWSVTQGAAQILRGSAADSPTRVSKDGSAEVQLTLLNLTDPGAKDALVFELAMNSMDMSAPSFETVDLKRAITLQADGGVSVPPSEVRIAEWGHMGHHVRGRLVFPQNPSALKARLVRVTIRGIGGVEKRVLEWRIAAPGR